MDKKSLKLLEYEKIKSTLSEYAHSELAKKKCLELLPSTNFNEIEKTQKETSFACYKIRLKGVPNFKGIKNIIPALKRLEIDASLSIRELLNILSLLKTVESAKKYSYVEENTSNNFLDECFFSLDTITVIKKELERCIISEELLADESSPKLSSIRKSIKNINSRIHNELNSILLKHKDFLMDNVISLRGTSYVIPIKAEYKNKVQGIVHGQSQSGSTYFIEPLSIVNMNNELKEIENEEKKEIEIILYNLSKAILPYSDTLKTNQELLVYLDFCFAKAKFSNSLNANEAIFNKNFYINLKEARHPLLNKDSVVPINISLGKDYNLLIITGPNTGGKTVALKTVGLFCLMGQSGLHIPAFYGSELAVFENIFVDIGDEQSIEQNLSTFSGHMKRIVEIVAKADSNSLCLFDEIGAGTDPIEGAALGISILSFLHKLDVKTMATTHYSELKVFALNTENVENASCEFDIKSLKPTYKILIGTPGHSNAFEISKRLGLSLHLIEDAKKYINEENTNFENLLTKLEENRLIMENDKKIIQENKEEISKLKEKYQKSKEKLERQRESILENAKEEARQILKKAKEVADESIKTINKLSSDNKLAKLLEKQRENIRTELNKNIKKEEIKNPKPSKIKATGKLNIGDNVFVNSMNINAKVNSLVNDKGFLYILIGSLRTKVHINDLRKISTDTNEQKKENNKKSASLLKAMYISPEINLISHTVDEAIAALEKYLDDALLSHLDYVRIIHGRGTFALQKGIHKYLKSLSFIKSFKIADFEEGGSAVTIVNFK